jgi:hypothetical protein
MAQGKEVVGGKKAGPSAGRAGPDRGKKTDRAWVLLVWAGGLGWVSIFWFSFSFSFPISISFSFANSHKLV